MAFNTGFADRRYVRLDFTLSLLENIPCEFLAIHVYLMTCKVVGVQQGEKVHTISLLDDQQTWHTERRWRGEEKA